MGMPTSHAEELFGIHPRPVENPVSRPNRVRLENAATTATRPRRVDALSFRRTVDLASRALIMGRRRLLRPGLTYTTGKGPVRHAGTERAAPRFRVCPLAGIRA